MPKAISYLLQGGYNFNRLSGGHEPVVIHVSSILFGDTMVPNIE